jgi:sulfur carrier protein
MNFMRVGVLLSIGILRLGVWGLGFEVPQPAVNQGLILTVRSRRGTLSSFLLRPAVSLRITLNGEPYDLDEPLSVADLLVRLAIDPRRVAVEHNLVILRRPLFTETLVQDGDRVEIVNFVGGG